MLKPKANDMHGIKRSTCSREQMERGRVQCKRARLAMLVRKNIYDDFKTRVLEWSKFSFLSSKKVVPLHKGFSSRSDLPPLRAASSPFFCSNFAVVTRRKPPFMYIYIYIISGEVAENEWK